MTGKSRRGYRTVLTSSSQDQAAHKQHVSRAAFLTPGGVCRHTEVAFGSRVAALELLLKLPGLVW